MNGLKLNPMFTDNMVLQRDSDIEISGFAKEGSFITIEICEQRKKTISENGVWKIILDNLSVGGPYTMSITSHNDSYTEKILLEDILVGDVYIVAGQSNMEFELKDSLGGEIDVNTSNNPNIRYYRVPAIEYEDEKERIPNYDDGSWVKCNPENSKYFSAVAYHFAKDLQNEVNIPIGIIGCYKGGTSASSWMNEVYLSNEDDIKACYLDEYNEIIRNLSDEEEIKQISNYNEELNLYLKRQEQFKKDYPNEDIVKMNETIGEYPWPPPMGRRSYQRPCGLYYTMFSKINKTKAKAVIWYQGEEDTKNAQLYEKLLTNLIQNWRADLNNSSICFICVQLPSYNIDDDSDNWPIVREAQLNVSKKVNDVELVVTIDCGDPFDIHPIDKKDIGTRIALVAKNTFYEKDKETFPMLEKVEKKDDEIKIYFKNIKSSLTTKDKRELIGLEILESKGKLYNMKVKIYNNYISIKDDYVQNIKEIRYGWSSYSKANLCNEENLPACPFRVSLK